MLELAVYNKEGKKVDKVKVDEALFGSKVRAKLLRDVIVMYEANQRSGTASTKRRSEVKGSSKKPWKQKGTGRARVGTVRSPIWRHGGIVFGPHPRDYSYSMPKKMKRSALNSALLSKFQDKETLVIDTLTAEKAKTKEVVSVLKNIGIKETCLIGVKGEHRNLHISTRNIRGTLLKRVCDLNAYDVLKYQRLLLTKEALQSLMDQRQEAKGK
ncbi:MAG: 50S ribosomal protein L4 [Planctomycetes bacterium]|nr:50S ribosomal protein L4 [Planctomycetota bacterium]